jgi:5-methylcytosine-specific restriction enzyme A
MTRNPNWTRDELILALSLYMRAGRRQLEASHPEVAELSADLNKLPIHGESLRGTDFRNPQGVSMKLGNFLSIDPLYEGLGLQRGGRLDREVWDEFENDIPRLNQTAKAISENAAQIAEKPGASYEPVRQDEEFPEGKLLTSVHQRKERNPKAVHRKKERVLKETGRLLCEACDFDFAVQYGKLGHGFAECHHTIPVGQLTEGHPTRLADLVIVCANCHRIIHRTNPMLTVAQLRLIIKQNKL